MNICRAGLNLTSMAVTIQSRIIDCTTLGHRHPSVVWLTYLPCLPWLKNDKKPSCR